MFCDESDRVGLCKPLEPPLPNWLLAEPTHTTDVFSVHALRAHHLVASTPEKGQDGRPAPGRPQPCAPLPAQTVLKILVGVGTKPRTRRPVLRKQRVYALGVQGACPLVSHRAEFRTTILNTYWRLRNYIRDPFIFRATGHRRAHIAVRACRRVKRWPAGHGKGRL